MNMNLPTGTVTFLFTDVEGSTTLWEQRAVAMRAALERHDRLLREAIASSCGHVVKTMGDGLVAVFADAKQALAASLAAQHALHGTVSNHVAAASDARAPVTLKVRMGLHTGVADARDGDYFGTAVNRAARIMSVAHGEQILLSAATAHLVRGDCRRASRCARWESIRSRVSPIPSGWCRSSRRDCVRNFRRWRRRGAACRRRTTHSSVAAMRSSSSNDVSRPGRGWCRCWASAAAARPGS